MEEVACNICGADRASTRLLTRDYKYSTPGLFRIVECDNCGLAFTSPRPTTSEIAAFYPSTVVEHAGDGLPNPFSESVAARVTARSGAPGKLLDVGCASGSLLRSMRQRGWEVFGIEPAPDAAAKAAGVPGARIKCGVLEDGDFPSGTFDAVTLWSVLEHLHDPRRTLRIIRDILNPAGLLHLCLPNFDSLERRLFGPRWFGLDMPRHLYHFSPATIRRLLREAGFDVLELSQASGHDVLKFSIDVLRGREPHQVPRGGALEALGAAPRASAPRMVRRWVNRAAVGGFTGLADRLGLGSQMLIVAAPAGKAAAGCGAADPGGGVVA